MMKNRNIGPGIVTYNALIQDSRQRGHMQQGIQRWNELLSCVCWPDDFTFATNGGRWLLQARMFATGS